jgi:hypothetical protein
MFCFPLITVHILLWCAQQYPEPWHVQVVRAKLNHGYLANYNLILGLSKFSHGACGNFSKDLSSLAIPFALA